MDAKLCWKHVKIIGSLLEINRGPLYMVQGCNKINFRVIRSSLLNMYRFLCY